MKLFSARIVFAALMVLGWVPGVRGQVIISEFMASNSNGLTDQDGEYSDWVELHNAGPTAVDLQGWFLTDNVSQLSQWRFPSVTLPSGGYLVVFASGKNRTTPGTPLHTSFSLAADGEYLALVQPNGTTVASEFEPAFPRQLENVSYGAVQGALNYFTVPSPGAPNSPGFAGLVADTRFSHDRGFYDRPFDLAITTATPDAVIRYTTNGVPPTATTGSVYSGPIRISGTTVVRAGAFRTGYLPSEVDTQTYLFISDVIRQSPDGRAPQGWPTSWGANVVNYGMDPDVVDSPRYSATIENDLKTIPSFSLVMDLKDLFDPSRGIYANPGQDGINWERPASLELLFPDDTDGFQVNAGVRIRGGYSRSTSNPKHAFRFFFREEYGDAKLIYPLFGDAGTDVFDALDLRTFQNYSWSFEGDERGVFIRDQFSRDAQLAMGHPGERGDYYHLYVNGQYWGLFNTAERPEASYGATYFGGEPEDYDVIKVAPDTGYTIYATDGNLQAWTRLWNAARAGFSSDAAYQQVQGNNPDGTPNPEYEVLLDVDNLIDYMLVILYGGNLDAPISNFLGNTSPNNFFALRNRNGREGFRFFVHDAEHTLLNVTQNRIGPFPAGSTLDKSNPQWVWQQLWANAEFRLRVADHVHRHFFNGGVLTPEGATNLFLKRKAEIDRAVVAESARWGDSKRGTPRTRDVEWIAEVNRIVNNYIPQRTGIVLGQLRSKNLYPDIAAPAYSQHGGSIPRNFSLSMTVPAATIYYTLNGADPRLPGGAVSPSALTYSQPVVLAESAIVKSRAWDGSNWSALNEAEFVVIQTFKELHITELMFNPPSQNDLDGEQFEFLELKNVGPVELDLSGVHFTAGIQYRFPNGSKLRPGEFAVLASDSAAFATKYPGVAIAGVYEGSLSNGGESVTLVHAVGTPIFSVAYGDAAPWPISADGEGFSLVPVNPNVNPEPSSATNWRASSRLGGSPGADDAPANIQPVWVNEILTHTDPPDVDQIELFNPGPAAADISYWFLTDSRSEPRKFQIPAGTILQPGEYKLFTESEFNTPGAAGGGFRLDSHGEEVYLYSADSGGNLTGYSDGFSYEAAANGVSFGRYITSTGQIHYPPQRARTFTGPNAGPLVGPVVINEINYAPGLGDEEFIELKNITAAAVKLYDPAYPENRWRMEGVGFDFPVNSEIPANGLALLVGSDPAGFRSRRGVPAAVPVFGPYLGVLQNTGELLELRRPDAPDVATNGTVIVPHVVIDAVRYNDRAPWPTNAAGLGSALERVDPAAYGDDPINWRASAASPSPGFENNANRVPRLNVGADRTFQTAQFPFVTSLTGTASDDGQPNPPGVVTVTWTQVSGPGPVSFDSPNQLTTTGSFPGVGTYVLRLSGTDGTLQASDEVTITIERTPAEVTLVAAGSVWKYLDDGSDQGSFWRTPEFSDTSWKSGPARLGYGDGVERTQLGFGPDGSNKYRTYYFRHTFEVRNAAAVKQLTVKLLRDDGGIVYINGIEVFRSNMPVGEISFDAFSASVVSDADESTFFESAVNASVLREGRNVLAVEIHQCNAGSSDLAFDAMLTGLVVPDNQPPVVNAGADFAIALSATGSLQGSAIDDGLPVPPGRVAIQWSKMSGPGDVIFGEATSAVTTARFSVSGTYVLQLAANDSALTSADNVTITVTGDPFAEWQATYFTPDELSNPTVSDSSADADGDGHSNLQEFYANTHPKDARSALKASSVEWRDGAGLPLLLRFEAMPDRSYTVQFQESAESPWVKLRDVPAQTTAQMVEISDLPAGNARFYRIVTPQQP